MELKSGIGSNCMVEEVLRQGLVTRVSLIREDLTVSLNEYGKKFHRYGKMGNKTYNSCII